MNVTNNDYLQSFEYIKHEYDRLAHMIQLAVKGQAFSQRSSHSVLTVDPATQKILDANDAATELLGYTLEEFQSLVTTDLTAVSDGIQPSARYYVEDAMHEQVYQAIYRHRDGRLIPVEVSHRSFPQNESAALVLYIEEISLSSRLQHELQRREDSGFAFQQRLKTLNEITIQLSQIDSHDELCRQAILQGITHLGFDRLGIWFYDASQEMMVGSYGTDEQGQLRSEAGNSWTPRHTYVQDFLDGKTMVSYSNTNVPIYNHRSEVIQYGWRISAPMTYGGRFIGVINSDNYLRRQPMKSHEPELLRLYGNTIGHLLELAQVRQQAFELRIRQERHNLLAQFVTDVGHDFRTPLSIINVNNFLLQRTTDGERRKEMAATIQNQVTHISYMLDSMLEYIALETQPALTLQPIQMLSLVEEVVTAQHDLIHARQIEWSILPDADTLVMGDLHYLRQAIAKIIENALQYTPEGKQVCVSFVHHPRALGIRIQDTGIGIAPDEFENIFKPLYRVNQARTERRNGLGLPIARAIVAAHQGHITVQSTLDEGSTFEIILPTR